MHKTRLAWLACLALLAASRAPAQVRTPHLGYAYPAGGQQGSTFAVVVGGEWLNNTKEVHFSGTGVQAKVVEQYRALGPGQAGDAARYIREYIRKINTEKAGKAYVPEKIEEKLPNHPALRDLDKKPLEDLWELMTILFNPKRQLNPQLSEEVALEVTIDPAAAAGDRELRLRTPEGLTNPLSFQIGQLPEILEQERYSAPPPPTPVPALPAVINGQIMPGDVDRFKFHAKRGQRLVFGVSARVLVPYLADAVPGWFQAALSLTDGQGREVAYADDYTFQPDPVLCFESPKDDDYVLEIRDAIYRGREDFIYRVAVGERPFVMAMFPLGGPVGRRTLAGITGWNLPFSTVELDTSPGPYPFRQALIEWRNHALSNQVQYMVDELPETDEIEPNDDAKQTRRVEPPVVVNGQIERPGDLDNVSFTGRAGQEVVAEVFARRLGSPLDALLRLYDRTDQIVAWNDDYDHPETGLVTHHADSRLAAKLPADGVYRLQLSDTQRHGGGAYAYRLRIGPPRPDFQLRVTPSSLNAPSRCGVPITVHAQRIDGFDGDIWLGLRGATQGFDLIGGWVPRGRDKVRVTLVGPPKPQEEPIKLQLVGSATIGDGVVVHNVLPADDMMQAFAYHHLVLAQELMVIAARPKGIAGTLDLPGGRPVRVPLGGEARTVVKTGSLPKLEEVSLELSEPPKGVTLGPPVAVEGGVALTLKADANVVKAGYADNLIIEAFREVEAAAQGNAPKRKNRWSLGYLPAVPFIVAER